ncbi:arginine-tRNA-protein transferase [Lineolata rhizophorae]|uniref:arginyltransferase n=1 Tax=Lineolata rhizophorae TaxID=578093 RepID=A0A6A6P9G0_9PEZI|nr:arginine-tRNA-protein transferase [Lineolata rhizophorae]
MWHPSYHGATWMRPPSVSYFASSDSLRVEDYQELLDRGWRRSGSLLYKPDPQRSCCPHYAIRLKAADLKTSRDQRQAINRWNRFVLGEEYIKEISRRQPKTREDKKRQKTEFNLLAAVHQSEYDDQRDDLPTLPSSDAGAEAEDNTNKDKNKKKQPQPPLPRPAHKLTVNLEPDSFSEEKFALFEHYQRVVHKEKPHEISRHGFRRFLCGSPLRRRTEPAAEQSQQHPEAAETTTPAMALAAAAPPRGGRLRHLGSYHQCYRLDGRLVALAVLDLLPHAVSAVYFIYHSDLEAFSLGKVSALREAALALEEGHEYYYMGYYIHGCAKMRYKAAFKPQEVLDYETGAWGPLEDVLGAMEEGGYASASLERWRKAKGEGKEDGGEGQGGEERKGEDEDEGEKRKSEADPNEVPRPLRRLFLGSPREAEAAALTMSLLDIGFAGMMSEEELMEQVNLGAILITNQKGENPQLFLTSFLVGWEESDVKQSNSIKGIIAELVALLGPAVASRMVVRMAG